MIRRHRLVQLGSDRRIGVHSRRQLRQQQRTWVRSRVHVILITFGVVLALCLTVRILLPWPIVPYLIGAAVASTGWWIFALMLEFGGVARRRAGVSAEQSTAAQLRPLRRKGWIVVNHVMTQHWDIDHALLGPGGWIAVETKFRSSWTDATGLDEMARQATRAAQALEGRIGGWRPPARPIVAMWGPDVIDVHPAPFELDGVTFCAGSHLSDLVRSMPAIVSDDEIRARFECLDAYLRRRDPAELAAHGGPPTTVDDVVGTTLQIALSVLLATAAVLAATSVPPVGVWGALVAASLAAGSLHVRRRWDGAVRIRLVSTAVMTSTLGLGGLLSVVLLTSVWW